MVPVPQKPNLKHAGTGTRTVHLETGLTPCGGVKWPTEMESSLLSRRRPWVEERRRCRQVVSKPPNFPPIQKANPILVCASGGGGRLTRIRGAIVVVIVVVFVVVVLMKGWPE